MRLPSRSGLSYRRISSTATLIRAGLPINCGVCAGSPPSATSLLPIIGGRLVAGVEQEDALVQQCFRSAARHCPRPDMRRVSTSVRDRAVWRAGALTSTQIREHIGHRTLPRAKTSGPSTGSSAPRIASDQPRSGSRSSSGMPSRLPMIQNRNRRREILDQVDLAFDGERSDRSTSATRPGSISAMCAAIAHRRSAAAPRCARGIVEDEAGGVVLVEQRSAEFRRELLFLVRAEESVPCRR